MEPRRAILRVLDDTQPMKTSAQGTTTATGQQAPALKLVETRPSQKEETSMTTTATTPAPAVDTFADDTLERVRALLAPFTPQQVEELKGILPGGATGQQKPTESRLMKVPTPAEAKALAPRMFATHWERPGNHVLLAQRLEGLSFEELTVLVHNQFSSAERGASGLEKMKAELETALDWFVWEETPGKAYVTLTLTKDVLLNKHTEQAMRQILEAICWELEAYTIPYRPVFVASHLTEVATRLEDYFTARPAKNGDASIFIAGLAFASYMQALLSREDLEEDWAPLERCLEHFPGFDQAPARVLIDAGLLAELKDDSGKLTGFVFPLLSREQDA